MNNDAVTDLLRILGSGISPNARRQDPIAPHSLDFSSLLDLARSGDIRSGLTVTVDPQLGIELEPEKAEILSRIADIAQAQGIDRVLVTDGDEQFVLDVELRVLTERAQLGAEGLITGIDAAVTLDLPDALNGAESGNTLPTELLLRGLMRFGRAAG